MSQSTAAHTVSLQQTLKSVEVNINNFGPGPHNPQQAEKLKELVQLRQKLKDQIQGLPSTVGTDSPKRTPSPINQGGPTVGVSSITNANNTGIKHEVQPIVIAQPGASQMPQIMTSIAQDDDKILSKQRLQELVKEIDPNEQLDEEVEEMLMQLTDDFIESVVGAACNLAQHRNSKVLEVKDLKLHLEKQWNITVPGYGSDEIKPFKKPLTTEAHKQRLALIRKATKKS